LKGKARVSLQSLDQAAFRRRLGIAVAVPVIALIALALVFLALLGYLQATMRWVSHSDEVLAQANRLERLLVDRESGMRGYLVTGSPSFLEPYQQAQRALGPLFDDLDRLVADYPAQTQRLVDLRRMADQWDAAARPLLAAREGGDDPPLEPHVEEQRQMGALRAALAAFLATEADLRDQPLKAQSPLCGDA
jgi:CHASE3 domain sensor protein